MQKNVYVVAYDLIRPGQDYSGLTQRIKACGSWRHIFESTWIVAADMTAQQLYSELKDCVDHNDKLLIIEVTDNYHGQLSPRDWDWLRRQTGLSHL